jgi:hypothetical protein
LKSGAQPAGFENSIVLPTASIKNIVFAPTVVKLPVGVNDSVCAAPPLTWHFRMTARCRRLPRHLSLARRRGCRVGDPKALRLYGELCGWTLARAPARSGERIAIAAYLGSGHVFDDAITKFAAAHADQNETDYQALASAVSSGRITADRAAC